jgi:hypothetical protein
MAKVTPVFPTFIKDEQTQVDNSQQLVEALETLKNQLNFGYQKDLKDEQTRLEWFLF